MQSRRRSHPRRPTGPQPKPERIETLSSFCLSARLGVPDIGPPLPDAPPSVATFRFPEANVDGAYDTATGELLTVSAPMGNPLTSVVAGSADPLRRMIAEIVPAPNLIDLRGRIDAMEAVLESRMRSLEAGDLETLHVVDLAVFCALISARRG